MLCGNVLAFDRARFGTAVSSFDVLCGVQRTIGNGDEGSVWLIEGDVPPPLPSSEKDWTEVCSLTCSGSTVDDMLKIFDEGDTLLKEWHDQLGDTYAPHAPSSTVQSRHTPSRCFLQDLAALPCANVRPQFTRCGSLRKAPIVRS